MKPRGPWLLTGLAIIWLVTAYDVFTCQWLTPDAERNPLAAWVIERCGLWPFVSIKIINTAIATEWLRHLHWGHLAFISVSYLALATYLLTF